MNKIRSCVGNCVCNSSSQNSKKFYSTLDCKSLIIPLIWEFIFSFLSWSLSPSSNLTHILWTWPLDFLVPPLPSWRLSSLTCIPRARARAQAFPRHKNGLVLGFGFGFGHFPSTFLSMNLVVQNYQTCDIVFYTCKILN